MSFNWRIRWIIPSLRCPRFCSPPWWSAVPPSRGRCGRGNCCRHIRTWRTEIGTKWDVLVLHFPQVVRIVYNWTRHPGLGNKYLMEFQVLPHLVGVCLKVANKKKKTAKESRLQTTDWIVFVYKRFTSFFSPKICKI